MAKLLACMMVQPRPASNLLNSKIVFSDADERDIAVAVAIHIKDYQECIYAR